MANSLVLVLKHGCSPQGQNFILWNEVLVLSEGAWGILGVAVPDLPVPQWAETGPDGSGKAGLGWVPALVGRKRSRWLREGWVGEGGALVGRNRSRWRQKGWVGRGLFACLFGLFVLWIVVCLIV